MIVRSMTYMRFSASQYASKVYVLVRRDQLRASKVMAKRLLSHPKVEVIWNSAPVEAKGDGVSRFDHFLA